MKPTKKKFVGVRELVDSMKDDSKRIWISCDDPVQQMLEVVDENLENLLEISLRDYNESAHLLNVKEQQIFKNKRYWELVGAEISEHQKYLLSDEHWLGMTQYMQRNLRKELDKSLLRLNGRVDPLGEALPYYDLDPQKGLYHFDKYGKEIVFKDQKVREMIPLFEITKTSIKEQKNIWDVKMDFDCSLIDYEEDLYKKIIENLGEVDKIIIPVRTQLAVLPCMDWAHGKAGFIAFENIGIGIYK